MRDPMRIPGVLDELRATWEAQPDVSLPELWARLEARGVALNSSDSELADALRAERAAHPFSVSFLLPLLYPTPPLPPPQSSSRLRDLASRSA